MAIDWNDLRTETMDECVVALFDAYEVPAVRLADGTAPDASHNLASVIGFTSSHMRGSVAIFTADAVVNATNPLEGENATRDWLAELANQLLGRIKNKMLRYGVQYDMSTPVVVAGQSTIQLHQIAKDNASYSYGTDAGSLTVTMDVVIEEGFELQEPAAEEASDVMIEGDLMLF